MIAAKPTPSDILRINVSIGFTTETWLNNPGEKVSSIENMRSTDKAAITVIIVISSGNLLSASLYISCFLFLIKANSNLYVDRKIFHDTYIKKMSSYLFSYLLYIDIYTSIL